MTISQDNKRMKWIAFLILILLFIGVLPTPKELKELLEIDALIQQQNEICSIVENELELSIQGLYGVPQDLQLPNIVVSNLRARYALSSIHTDAGIKALDEALLACTTRKKYRNLVDRIYNAVYPGRWRSAD